MHKDFADQCFDSAVGCFNQWFHHQGDDPSLALGYWKRGHGLCRKVAEERGSDPKDVAISAICHAAFS